MMLQKWIVSLTVFTAVVVSAIVYADLPASMAIHFDTTQNPDNYVAKWIGAFLLPVVMIVVVSITRLAIRFERDENKRRRALAVNHTIDAIISVLLLAVHLFTLAYNLGYTVSVSIFATLAVGLVLLLVGNQLPRLPQGSMQWPKLPEEAAGKYKRFVGRLMMIIGVVFMALALLPVSVIFPAFFICLAAFIVMIFGHLLRSLRRS